MKELEKIVIEDLLRIYKRFLESDKQELIHQEAMKIYNQYITGKTLLSKKIMKAVISLFPIAYPNSGSGLKTPSKKEVKEIIKSLENE